MIITEELVRQVIAWAMLKTSKSLGIIGGDETSLPDNVLDLISASPDHKKTLQAFADAYQNWYEFHLVIYKKGKSGNLSDTEHVQLLELIKRRDAARKALVETTS
jgi:hypothetical protein